MIHLAAVLLYGGAFLLWFRGLARGTPGGASRAAVFTAAAAAAVHGVALGLYTVRWDELPLAGLGPSLSTLSLMMALGVVGAMGLREASRVGIVIMPLVVFLEAVALATGIHPTAGTLDYRSAWFAFHASLGFAALCGMALAGAAGTLYLAQLHELRSKRLGRLFHFLPPLDTLDRLGRIGAAGGFVLLTLALGIGWAWEVRFAGGGAIPLRAVKVAWGLFVWAVIAAVLLSRRGRGRREVRGAWASAVGFAVIVASYVVMRAGGGTGGLFL